MTVDVPSKYLAGRPADSGATATGASLTPSTEQVREQLARVIVSPSFTGGGRTRSFLHYIVEQTLEGNACRLKQYTIATEGLGRDRSFDPSNDPFIRLEAGKLRRALELHYFRSGRRDPVRITVPKGSYVPVFEFNTVAAGDDMLPFGAAQEGDQPRTTAGPSQRLSVLPLLYEAGDEASRLVAAALGDQLTVELARYRDLAVIPVATPADTVSDGISIGLSTKSRFVFSGSVRQAEGLFRLTCRLLDVETGSLIWTDGVDLDAPKALSLETQDQAARHIASIVADYFGVVSHALSLQAVYGPAQPWNVQDAIHRHRYLARTLTERVYHLTRRDLEYGSTRMPDHPMIWAALGHTIFYGNVLGFGTDDDWETLVDRCAEKAFGLDHRCAFGYVVTALSQLYNRQSDDVLVTCDRILASNPHAPSSKLSAGFFRALAGDWDSGTAMLTEALQILPHPPGWAHRVTCLNYFRKGEFERALHEVGKYHAPDHLTPSLLRAAVLSRLGRHDQARMAAAEVTRIAPRFQKISKNYFRYLIPSESMFADLADALASTGLLR
jgi:adenylate cyclase